MRFVATVDLGTCGPVFAYPAAQPSPPPGLWERFAAERTEVVRHERERQDELARLLGMNAGERKAWVHEQRARLSEFKRLHDLRPEQRREYVNKVRAEHGPILYRTHEPAARRDDADGAILFTEPVKTAVQETRTVTYDDAAHDGSSVGHRDEALDIGIADLGKSGAARSTPRSFCTELIDPDDPHADWQRWLASNLLHERELIFDAIGGAIADVIGKRDDEIRALRDRVIKLEAQIDLVTKMGRRRR
jgi:hypothetical protein